MKKLCAFAVILGALTSLALAQEPTPALPDLRRDATPPTSVPVSPTPEMWFYEQERIRHDDPKAAVRRNAEYRAAQRQSRIESMKWFGMSNSRPMASGTPHMGTYSPYWSSTNHDPYRWTMGQQPTIVLRPSTVAY